MVKKYSQKHKNYKKKFILKINFRSIFKGAYNLENILGGSRSVWNLNRRLYDNSETSNVIRDIFDVGQCDTIRLKKVGKHKKLISIAMSHLPLLQQCRVKNIIKI